jgi:uncharacterized membrane protein YjjB (DUF3815 family)
MLNSAACVGPFSVNSSLEAGTYLLFVLTAGVAYVFRLRVEWRDVVWVLLACVIAAFAAQIGVASLGSQLGAFLAALVVGLASNLFALVVKRPAAVMQVPGLILLVPGSIGFQSFKELFSSQTVIGVQSAFQMFVTTTALVYGIFVANLLFPSRGIFSRLRYFGHLALTETSLPQAAGF